MSSCFLLSLKGYCLPPCLSTTDDSMKMSGMLDTDDSLICFLTPFFLYSPFLIYERSRSALCLGYDLKISRGLQSFVGI